MAFQDAFTGAQMGYQSRGCASFCTSTMFEILNSTFASQNLEPEVNFPLGDHPSKGYWMFCCNTNLCNKAASSNFNIFHTILFIPAFFITFDNTSW